MRSAGRTDQAAEPAACRGLHWVAATAASGPGRWGAALFAEADHLGNPQIDIVLTGPTPEVPREQALAGSGIGIQQPVRGLDQTRLAGIGCDSRTGVEYRSSVEIAARGDIEWRAR